MKAPARRAIHLLAAVACGAATPTAAAADIPWQRAWYQVEIIVFDRAGASDAGENLLHDEPRAFPLASLAFEDGPGRAAFYPPDLDTGPQPEVDLVGLAALGVDVNAAFRRARPPPVDETPAPTTATGAPGLTPSVTPPPLQALEAATARFEESLAAISDTWLPAERLRLVAERSRLERQPGYRVLLHGAWLQATPDRDRPEPRLLQMGARVGDVFEVEGTVAATVARYLHLGVVLWQQVPPEMPIADVPLETSAGHEGTAIGPEHLATPSEEKPTPAYRVLREQRRMRSGEVHYIDHPRLGVLARIDPVDVPADLQALAASLP